MSPTRPPTTHLLCCFIVANSVAAFRSPAALPVASRTSRANHDATTRHRISPTPSRNGASAALDLANDDKLLEELDEDLAREVEEALLLANEALTSTEDDEEAEIAEIAAALTTVPVLRKQDAQESRVAPPQEDPPLFTSVFGDSQPREDDAEDESRKPLPPPDPPSLNALSFGETLQRAVSDEIERLKNLLFGIKQELEETQSNVVSAESTVDTLKREIEQSRMQREAIIQDIERQFAEEKESLMGQLRAASEELQVVMEQSTTNITTARAEASAAERGLLDRMDQFAASIKLVTEETVKANMEKEQLINSKQLKIEQVKQERSEKLRKYKADLMEEGEGIKLYNAKLKKKADEAERRVRDIYENVNRVREDRISLQRQIEDVERESLEQIATLEQQILEDDVEYTSYLEAERARIDKLIADAKEKYASILAKERAKRESVESDFQAELARKEEEGKVAIAAIESKAKAKLDELEEKHSQERMAIYQEKVEAVSAVRKEMLAQLEIENQKLNSIHEEMRPKIESVRSEIVEVKAAFEQELEERRQVAEAERKMFLNRMEDIRSDMVDKINTQRKIIEAEKAEYLREQNIIIDESEEQCRRAWMELATLKKRVGDAGERRNELIDEVNMKSDLILQYESDRKSFRKSLRLSFQAARDKIGSGTRRVFGRDRETTSS